MMYVAILQTCLFCTVYVLALDDLYVNGDISQEMVEKGRSQYQLLKERGTLPRYGSCWKSAVGQVDDGCKHLSEETQSDIALHLTNCFLEMSGHQTYECISDRKPNLRAICINTMSDRAFNVYTEFYTHTQNMCWFLRGQIWHETISQNTFKVGKQLEISAENQEKLIGAQRESLQVQEQILRHGRLLETVLEDLYVSTRAHQEILDVLNRSLGSLQSWLVGEMSWFESVIFYVFAALFIFMFTSTKRTADSRLSVLCILFLNILSERLICMFFISASNQTSTDPNSLYKDIYSCVWYCRYLFIFASIVFLLYRACFYRDLIMENFKLLEEVKKQNHEILEMMNTNKSKERNSSIYVGEYDVISENRPNNTSISNNNIINNNNDDHVNNTSSCSNAKNYFFGYSSNSCTQKCDDEAHSPHTSMSASNMSHPEIIRNGYRNRRNDSPKPHPSFQDSINGIRYNLRSSRQNTPEIK